MKLCPVCGYHNTDNANYCSQCGNLMEAAPSAGSENRQKVQLKLNFGVSLLSLLLSLVLTYVLTTFFHLPIYIFGLFLPFFFRVKRSH